MSDKEKATMLPILKRYLQDHQPNNENKTTRSGKQYLNSFLVQKYEVKMKV